MNWLEAEQAPSLFISLLFFLLCESLIIFVNVHAFFFIFVCFILLFVIVSGGVKVFLKVFNL